MLSLTLGDYLRDRYSVRALYGFGQLSDFRRSGRDDRVFQPYFLMKI